MEALTIELPRIASSLTLVSARAGTAVIRSPWTEHIMYGLVNLILSYIVLRSPLVR